MFAKPATEGSTTEVAVIVTPAGTGEDAGAVYLPVESIVPQSFATHPFPLTLHVTIGLVEKGVPVALNC
jgi:hypothetical protein